MPGTQSILIALRIFITCFFNSYSYNNQLGTQGEKFSRVNISFLITWLCV